MSNYRPISLQRTDSKVFEKIVHKYLFNFFRDNSFITAFQLGFVPGDSTVNQLIDIYNTFCKAHDEGKEVRTILCDISKAFVEFGIKVFFLYSNQQVYLDRCWLGSLII